MLVAFRPAGLFALEAHYEGVDAPPAIRELLTGLTSAGRGESHGDAILRLAAVGHESLNGS
jgi:hypothetical protein